MLGLEVFFSAGWITWQTCREPGQWCQPPLPYHASMKSETRDVGVRWKDWQLSYGDRGRIGTWGYFVEDRYYDPARRRLKNEYAPLWEVSTRQHTTVVKLTYAPRFGQTYWVQPEIGPALVHQHMWFNGRRVDVCDPPTWASEQKHSHRITPALGLSLGVTKAGVSAYVNAEYLHHPSYTDSVGTKSWSTSMGFAYAF